MSKKKRSRNHVRVEIELDRKKKGVVDQVCKLLGCSRNQFINRAVDVGLHQMSYALEERFENFAHALILKRFGTRVSLRNRSQVERSLKKLVIRKRELESYKKRQKKKGSGMLGLGSNTPDNYDWILKVFPTNANTDKYLTERLTAALERCGRDYLDYGENYEKLLLQKKVINKAVFRMVKDDPHKLAIYWRIGNVISESKLERRWGRQPNI